MRNPCFYSHKAIDANMVPFKISLSYCAIMLFLCSCYQWHSINIHILIWVKTWKLHQMRILEFWHFVLFNQKLKNQKWQCSQNLDLNPTFVIADLFWISHEIVWLGRLVLSIPHVTFMILKWNMFLKSQFCFWKACQIVSISNQCYLW